MQNRGAAVVGGPPIRGRQPSTSSRGSAVGRSQHASSGGFLASLRSQFERRSANDRAAVAEAAEKLTSLCERLLETPVPVDEARALVAEMNSAEHDTGVSDPAIWEDVAAWPMSVVNELRTAVELHRSMRSALEELREQLQQFPTREKLERRPLDALLSAMERANSQVFSQSVWACPALKRLQISLRSLWSEGGMLMDVATIVVLAAIVCRGSLFARLETTRPTDARVLLSSGIRSVGEALLRASSSFRTQVPTLAAAESVHFDAPYLLLPGEDQQWPTTLLPPRWSDWLRSALERDGAAWRAATETETWDWYAQRLEHYAEHRCGDLDADQAEASTWPSDLANPPPDVSRDGTADHAIDPSSARATVAPITDAAHVWLRTVRSLCRDKDPNPAEITRAWDRLQASVHAHPGPVELDPVLVLDEIDPGSQTSPLRLSIRQGRLGAVEGLLQLGALSNNATPGTAWHTDGTAWHTAAAAGAHALPMLELCARYTHTAPEGLRRTLLCRNRSGRTAVELAARMLSTGRASSALLVLLGLSRMCDPALRLDRHEAEALRHLGQRIARETPDVAVAGTNPRSESALLSLQQYCLDDAFADCTVVCPRWAGDEDEWDEYSSQAEWDCLPAHRLVLAAASPVWKAALEGGWRESTEQRVTIPFLNTDDTKRLLRFVYDNGDVGPLSTASDHTLLELLTAAQVLLLPALRTACVSVLRPRIDPFNVVAVYRVAVATEDVELRELCIAVLFSQLGEVSDRLVAAETSGESDNLSEFRLSLEERLPAWIIRPGGTVSAFWVVLCHALTQLALQRRSPLPTVELP